MSHRHHYGKDFGEPAIAVILVVGGVLALAMCRICCGQARKEKRELRRQGRRRYDVRPHHLLLHMPAHLETIEGHPVLTATAPIEFTASAPRYSLVMQNPSAFARAARPASLTGPETPPPPYRTVHALTPCVVGIIEEDDVKTKLQEMMNKEEWNDKSITNL